MHEKPYRRILVRATNWVGDAVMCLPALQALRACFPDSHIAILARPWVADLYRGQPFCDEVIEYDAPRGWKGIGRKMAAAKALRLGRFDCAILLQNAFEAALLAWWARIPVRIGYDRDGRGVLLKDRIPVPKPGEIPAHQRFYYLELLKRAGLLESYSPESPVAFTSIDAARQRGTARFQEYGVTGHVIGVSPGAAFGSAKRWLPERFAKAAVEVAKAEDATVAIFGTAEEAALGEQVAVMVGREGIRVVSLAGKTKLHDFIEMAAACELFLTNDSGSMHIASAMGVPTVAIFGPTDEAATGPAGTRYRILRHPVECAPCHLRECPIDHRCMTGVKAEEATGAAQELLKQVS
jgi:heptosyltransferase-2